MIDVCQPHAASAKAIEKQLLLLLSHVYILLDQTHRRIRSRRSSIVESLNVRIPLRNIRSQHSPIISHHPIDLALDIRRLCPHASAAGIVLHLIEQLTKQFMSAVVPRVQILIDLVGLVDCGDRQFIVPEVLDGDVVSDSAEFALDANSRWVVRA